MTGDRTATGKPQPSASGQYRQIPPSGQTVVTPPYPEQETPMVNGRPAIFRPMDPGVDNPPAQ
jgi:hypothetical protein